MGAEAKFPAEAPTVYEEKTTANDVGDTLHWDGADANQVKAEIEAIAGKVGVDEDENPASHDAKIRALEGRREVKTGSGTLSAGTTTTVNDAAVTGQSVVIVQGRSAGFYGVSALPYVSSKSTGNFTLTHGNAAGNEAFDYIVVN